MHPDLLKALRRLERKTSVPVQDFRRIFAMPDRGDPVCDGLVSQGWAKRVGDALELTDNGRRALEANR